jgi:hypothetical protein
MSPEGNKAPIAHRLSHAVSQQTTYNTYKTSNFDTLKSHFETVVSFWESSWPHIVQDPLQGAISCIFLLARALLYYLPVKLITLSGEEK